MCAVGAVRVRAGQIVDRFYTLVQPPAGVDSFQNRTFQVHGITPEQGAAARERDDTSRRQTHPVVWVAMNAAEPSAFSVERFFTERELHIAAKNAAEFYGKLTEVLDPLATYQHNNLGVPTGEQPTPAYFFRGQSDARWGLSSTLHRLYQDRFPKGYDTQSAERELAEAERRVLQEARRHGLIRGLSALELLTVLQHHGTPTRLLDVTTDWRVALFFALGDDATDGRLFLISQNTPQQPAGNTGTNPQSDELYWWHLADQALNTWNRTVTPILLPFTDARMIAQRGFFLVGGLVSSREGRSHYRGKSGNHSLLNNAEMRDVSSLAIELPNLPGEPELTAALPRFRKRVNASEWDATCVTIRIPGDLKSNLRKQLAADGIFGNSIYPPLVDSRTHLANVAGPGLRPSSGKK